MGRRKKANISRRNNLLKAQSTHATPPPSPVLLPDHIPTRDATPTEDVHPPLLGSNRFLDLESCGSGSSICSDEDMVIFNDNEERGELTSEAALASFAQFLHQAQVAAVAAEEERIASGGRKKRGKYWGTAPRTRRWREQKARESRAALTSAGQRFITQWVQSTSKDPLPAEEDDVVEVEKNALIFDVDKACEAIFNASDVGSVPMECTDEETMHLGNPLSVCRPSPSHHVEPMTNRV